MVSCDQASSPGHVLYDDRRIAWNMFPYMARQNPRIGVEPAPGREPDNYANDLTLEKGFLGEDSSGPRTKKPNNGGNEAPKSPNHNFPSFFQPRPDKLLDTARF